jgi:hypothetical protein
LSFIAVAPPPPGWTLKPAVRPTCATRTDIPLNVLRRSTFPFTIFFEGAQEYYALLHPPIGIYTSRRQVTAVRGSKKRQRKPKITSDRQALLRRNEPDRLQGGVKSVAAHGTCAPQAAATIFH